MIRWLDATRKSRTTFWVQATQKDVWHVESDDNCEVMLCGAFISVDAIDSRVQQRRGPRWCSECWMEFERLRRIAEFK